MLGRLYDAVVCQGLAPEQVQQLNDAAGVPVFDGLGTAQHIAAHLAALLGSEVPPADARRFVLQALLIASLS